MNLFGSRDDDPLLKNDPLAPSDDETSSEEEAERDEESDAVSTDGDTPVADGDSGTGETYGDSVFGATRAASDGEYFEMDGEGDQPILVRSLHNASNGRLTMLNAAFDQGWRLARIELRDAAPSEEEAPPEEGRSLAFHLRWSGG